jgi:hypothetical protein
MTALTIGGALVAATNVFGSEFRRDLYAAVGNWQIARTTTQKNSSCLIQSVYDGHSQIAFGIFGRPATTRIFLYASDLSLKPGATGNAAVSLIGLKRNSFEKITRYVAQESQLARMTMGSSIYQKMLTLRQNNDILHIELAGRSFQFNLAGTIDIMPDYMKCLNQL